MVSYVSQKDAIFARARVQGIPFEVCYERYMTSLKWASDTYPKASSAVIQFFTELWTWEHFWRNGETFAGVNPIYGELQDALHKIEDLKSMIRIKDDTITRRDSTVKCKENEIRNKAALIQRKNDEITAIGAAMKKKDGLVTKKEEEIRGLLRNNGALLDKIQKTAERLAPMNHIPEAEESPQPRIKVENKPLSEPLKSARFSPALRSVENMQDTFKNEQRQQAPPASPTSTTFKNPVLFQSAINIEFRGPILGSSNVADFSVYSPFRRPSSFSQHIWDKKAPDDASGPRTHTHFQFPTTTIFDTVPRFGFVGSTKERDYLKGTKRQSPDDSTVAEGGKRVRQEQQWRMRES